MDPNFKEEEDYVTFPLSHSSVGDHAHFEAELFAGTDDASEKTDLSDSGYLSPLPQGQYTLIKGFPCDSSTPMSHTASYHNSDSLSKSQDLHNHQLYSPLKSGRVHSNARCVVSRSSFAARISSGSQQSVLGDSFGVADGWDASIYNTFDGSLFGMDSFDLNAVTSSFLSSPFSSPFKINCHCSNAGASPDMSPLKSKGVLFNKQSPIQVDSSPFRNLFFSPSPAKEFPVCVRSPLRRVRQLTFPGFDQKTDTSMANASNNAHAESDELDYLDSVPFQRTTSTGFSIFPGTFPAGNVLSQTAEVSLCAQLAIKDSILCNSARLTVKNPETFRSFGKWCLSIEGQPQALNDMSSKDVLHIARLHFKETLEKEIAKAILIEQKNRQQQQQVSSTACYTISIVPDCAVASSSRAQQRNTCQTRFTKRNQRLAETSDLFRQELRRIAPKRSRH